MPARASSSSVCPAVQRAQPVVRAPGHLLDRGLAAQHATAANAQRPPAQIDGVSVACLRVDQIAVTGTLQRRCGTIARGDDVLVRMQLVRSGERARTRHRHRVAPARAAFGGDQVVAAVSLVEMRRLRKADRRARKMLPHPPISRRCECEYSWAARCHRNECGPGDDPRAWFTRYLRPSSSWNSEGSNPCC